MGRSERVRSSRVVALTAFVVSFVAFVPVLRNGFIRWDDGALLVENEAYRGLSAEHLAWMFTTTHKGPYQPFAWLTYGLDYTLYGMQPWGYHLTSLLIHAAAAAFVAATLVRLLPLLVTSLTERPKLVAGAALAGALIWGAHPLRVESIAWAAERRDVLAGLFLFASLWCWVRHLEARPDARAWSRSHPYWSALLLFVLSVSTKPTAVAFGVALLLLDAALRRCAPLRTRLAEKAPFVAAGIVFAVVAYWGQSGAGFVHSETDTTLIDRVVIAGYSATFYVVKTLIPTGLRVHYIRDFPFDPWRAHLVAGAAGAALVSVATLVRARRRPGIAAAWWSYLLLLAPVSGLTTLGSQLVGDRFAYVTTVPLLVLAAAGAARLLASAPARRLRLAATATACSALALSGGSALLARTWYDSETLFARVVDLDPRDWRAHTVYAAGAYDNGQFEIASRHAAIAVELRPRADAFPHALLGWIAYKDGRRGDAGDAARRALQLAPAQPMALRTLGNLADDAGDLEAAAAHLRAAVAAVPQSARLLTHLASLELRLGRDDVAHELTDRALARDPGNAAAWRLRGLLLESAGDRTGAADAYRRSMQLNPSSSAAAQSLAVLLGGAGDTKQAAELLRRAIELDQNAVDARMMLAGLHESQGRSKEAEQLYRDVLGVAPNEPRALGNLARVLAARGATAEAIDACARAAELLPREAGPRLQLAVLHRAAGDVAAARRAAEAARDLARDRGQEALVRRAETLLTQL